MTPVPIEKSTVTVRLNGIQAELSELQKLVKLPKSQFVRGDAHKRECSISPIIFYHAYLAALPPLTRTWRLHWGNTVSFQKNLPKVRFSTWQDIAIAWFIFMLKSLPQNSTKS